MDAPEETRVPGSDQYSITTVSQGSWSADVQYTAPSGGSSGTVLVDSFGAGSVSLTGVVSSAGDTVQATFQPPSVPSFVLTLSAVCDIAGGAVFTDGSSFYLFASAALSLGVSYPVVAGFGAFSEALAPPVCLGAGTRVRTARGMVEVETLRLSDRLMTHSGELRPVRWIGRQTLRCSSFAPPSTVWPVWIAPSAFGDGRPARELLLSPNHSVIVGAYLVPIRLLVNEASIRSIPAEHVDYYHVELETHDAILAEGLPVETYLDQGHRHRFRSLSKTEQWARPERHIGRPKVPAQAVRQAPFLPYADADTDLQTLQIELLERAMVLGYCRSSDPQLRFATGRGFLKTDWDGVTASSEIPGGVSEVMLLSDVATPSRQGATADHRSLGVAVVRIELSDRRIELADSSLRTGWYPVEGPLRWTNGRATIRMSPALRGKLIVQTAPMLQYWSYSARLNT